jgi:hypothetical protein
LLLDGPRETSGNLTESVLRQIEELKVAARPPAIGDVNPIERQRPHQMVIERRVPVWRGKWRLLPEVEKTDNSNSAG